MRRHHILIFAAAFVLATASRPEQARSATDNSAILDAKRQLSKADTELHRATLALSAQTNRIRKQVESTPQWKEAAAAAREAQARYTAAVKVVTASLATDAKYKAALGERARRRAERDALKADPKTPREEVVAAAVAALNAEAAVGRIERAARDADPSVADAKAAMDQANASLGALHAMFDELAEKDAAYQEARQRLQQASAASDDARKQLAQAREQQAEADRQQLDQDIQTRTQQLRDAAGWRR